MIRVLVRLLVGLSVVACSGPKSEPIGPHGPKVSGATRPTVYRESKGVEPIEFRCAEATRKAMPLFVELTKTHVRPVVAKDAEVLTNDCGAIKYDKQNKQVVETDVTCLYEAKDEAALRACWAASLARPRDKTEAVRDLEHIARGATAVIRRDGALPRGDVFPTPAIGCCARIGHRCRGSHSDTMLGEFGINVEHASYFQLAYQSDGVKVVVKAVGDLDCDGTTITYTLEGSAQGGELRYKIVEPTNPD